MNDAVPPPPTTDALETAAPVALERRADAARNRLLRSLDALRSKGTAVARGAREVTRIATPVAVTLAAVGLAAFGFFVARVLLPPRVAPLGLRGRRGRYVGPIAGALAQVVVTAATAGASALLRRVATQYLESRRALPPSPGV